MLAAFDTIEILTLYECYAKSERSWVKREIKSEVKYLLAASILVTKTGQ